MKRMMAKCNHCETTAVVVRTVKGELDKCREKHLDYRERITNCDERIHQLEAERDQAQAIVEVRDAVNVEDEKRITALEAGLRKYGRHGFLCPATQPYAGTSATKPPKCTCGLIDLIGENK